ncbi:MAG: hypothetical protein HQL76_10445 [Magnetococcales bacterium]|nr:hypothetical protein [Magnetococcales bacterium]
MHEISTSGNDATKVVAKEPHPLIRWALLLVLPFLAFLIWRDGQRYDPDVLDLASSGGTGSGNRDLSWIPSEMPPLFRQGALRQFDKDNLSDYVNGHAEAYLSAGFKGLIVAEYGFRGEEKSPRLTVDIYDMGQPLHAFGMLMSEIPANVREVAVGAMGFDMGQGIDFIQGRWFVKVTAFAPDLATEAMARQLAERLAQTTEPSELVIGFPELGTVVATRFIKENYHGLEFFDDVLERTFKREDTVFQAFLLTGTPRSLAERNNALLEFLAREKIPTTMVADGGLPHRVIHDPYEGDWFLVEREYRMLGVFGMAFSPLEGALKKFFKP